MILDLLGSVVPALHGMALCAVRAHLAAMHIRVATGAIPGDVREDRFDVALNAVHFFVHAAQGIFSFVVIEFGYGADRTPRRGGVAILTGDGEASVGIAAGLVLGSRQRIRCGGGV